MSDSALEELGSRVTGETFDITINEQHTVSVLVHRVNGLRGILPVYSTKHAACMDLYAALSSEFHILPPGEKVMVSTGLRMQIPEGYEVEIRPRSGLATKYGIIIPNAPGTIDADFRGIVTVCLWNISNDMYKIRYGDRIAQMKINPVIKIDLEEVNKLSDTVRGEGGFGHTGR